jgi:hypothetical protein
LPTPAGPSSMHHARLLLQHRGAHGAPHGAALVGAAEDGEIAQAEEAVGARRRVLGLGGEGLLGLLGAGDAARSHRGHDGDRQGLRLERALLGRVARRIGGHLRDRVRRGARALVARQARAPHVGVDGAQHLEHVGGLKRPVPRLVREQHRDELDEARRHVGHARHEARRRRGQARDHARRISGAGEGAEARAELEGHRAHGEEIAPRAEALEGTRALLGGHVLDGADHRVAIEPALDAAARPANARDAEVEQRRAHVGAELLEQHVLGLDVEVEHPAGVRVGQRLEHLEQHAADEGPAKIRADEAAERGAVAVGHHQQGRAGGVADQVEDGDDARVAEPSHGDDLGVEELGGAWIQQEIRADGLDGHVVSLLQIVATPHLPHTPPAEQDSAR